MARPRKVTEEVQKAVLPGDEPERFKMSEIGYSGFDIFSGITQDEINRELNFPYSLKVYEQMSYSPAINAPLSLYEHLISRAKFRFVPPDKATTAEKDECKFINECLHDMETSLRQILRDCLTSNKFGFAVLEKVFRKRYKSSGSKFDDGKIGLKKLSLRNQKSIEKFIFSEDGSSVIGVKQNLRGLDINRYSGSTSASVVIPRSKFLHVVVGKNPDDPYGRSLLRNVYAPYRYLEVLSEIEATGIAKDLNGMVMMKIPAQYLSTDASPEQKALLENFKNIARNVQVHQQQGVVMPSTVDEATKVPLFSMELMSVDGKKQFDINKVKEYYVNQIYTSLFADLLIQGQSGVGSFALAQVKSTLTGAAIESMLMNILESIERDVIRHLYELNNFDISRMGRLDYEGLTDIDLGSLSKAYQRLASTQLIEKDRDVLNAVRKSLGIDPRPDDEPVDKEALGELSSKSGAGLKVGTVGNGTAKTLSGTDTSSNNLENKG